MTSEGCGKVGAGSYMATGDDELVKKRLRRKSKRKEMVGRLLAKGKIVLSNTTCCEIMMLRAQDNDSLCDYLGNLEKHKRWSKVQVCG